VNKKYPSFFLDSLSMRKLRRSLQKTFDEENCEAFYLHRKLSIYITLFLAKAVPGLLPNHVTKAGAILGLLSALIIAVFYSGEIAAILGLLAYHVTYTADLVDGELARLKRVFSENAKTLDRIQDFALLSLLVATLVKTSISYDAIFAGAGVSAIAIFRFGMFEAANLHKPPVPPAERMRGLVFECLRYPFLWPGILLMNFIAAFATSVLEFDFYSPIFSIHLLIFTAHALKKFLYSDQYH